MKMPKNTTLIILGVVVIGITLGVLYASQLPPTDANGGNGDGGEGPLTAIFAKTDTITSMTYTFENKVFKVKGDKVWFKSNNPVHFAYNIYDPDVNEGLYFSINPNSGIVSEYPSGDIPTYLDSPIDLARRIDVDTPILEETTLDGKEVVKVQVGDIAYWIWKDYGIVIQTQTGDSPVSQYTDFDFTELSDTIFVIPPH